MKHTILGAGGSIGNALAYELLKLNEPVKLVSRSNFSIPGAESFRADLTSYAETLEGVRNSDVVYLCVGLKYDSRIWAVQWPLIMKNTINACREVNAKLIFFDNVYMYGLVKGKMTETTPYKPCSRKGEIRAGIARMLEEEMNKNNPGIIIARAADLYGPYANRSSMPYIFAFDKHQKGKKAQWVVTEKTTHSYTYTLDCAQALILLAKSNECFNQIWHLPTFNPALDGKTFIELSAKQFGVSEKFSILSKGMIKIAGLFDRTVYEINEMLYQYENDYYFDSTKFNNYFKYKPKSYEEGISETVSFLKSKN